MSMQSIVPFVVALKRLGSSLLTLCALSTMLIAAPITNVPEYNVKAAYLLLFARYVHWPENAFEKSDSPLVVGILGHDPFGSVLEATLRDQKIDSRPIHLLRVTNVNQLPRVHIAFIAGQSAREERFWLNELSAKPILIVADHIELIEEGATVAFVEEKGRLRFDVDYAAATKSQIKIASPMLVSARKVHGAPHDINGVQP